jgi:hypothetical protein
MKNIFKFILCGSLLVLLVGCKPAEVIEEIKEDKVTDERIKKDCLAIPLILSSLDEVISYTIDSKKEYESQITVFISLKYFSEEDTVDMDISMTYLKENSKWRFAHFDTNVVSILTDKLPDDEMVWKNAMPNGLNNSHEEWEFPGDIVFVSKTADSNTSRYTYVYEMSGGVLSWTHKTTWTIEAKYTLEGVYTYRLINEVYTEKTDWTGTWPLAYGIITESGIVGEYIDVSITGETGMTQVFFKTPTWTNTVMADFTYKGKEYHIPAEHWFRDDYIITTRGFAIPLEDYFLKLYIIFGYGINGTDANYYTADFNGEDIGFWDR